MRGMKEPDHNHKATMLLEKKYNQGNKLIQPSHEEEKFMKMDNQSQCESLEEPVQVGSNQLRK